MIGAYAILKKAAVNAEILDGKHQDRTCSRFMFGRPAAAHSSTGSDHRP
jgi:hypothetical protein